MLAGAHLTNLSTILIAAQDLCRMELGSSDRLFLIKADAACLPFAESQFDIIFCLDTLPYIHGPAKEAFLRQSARLLTPGGRIVFSLPIEVGPILLVRELARRWTGSWRDTYSLREIAAAVLFVPNAVVDEHTKQNLRGYDYRQDLQLIRSLYSVEKIIYSPLPFAGPLNPFVLCQVAAKNTC